MKKYLHLFYILIITLFFTHPIFGQDRGYLVFSAHLTGANEVPPTNSTAEGLVTVIINDDLTKMQLNGVVSGLSGPVTGVHFHLGAAFAVGGVTLNLMPYLSGNKLSGLLDVPANFIKNALDHKIYVNFHTQQHTGGEIRAQLELVHDRSFSTLLTGSQEVPAVLTNATALGQLIYKYNSEELNYFFLPTGLSGPITAAHIHDGRAGRNGGVVIGLSVENNSIFGDHLRGSIPVSSLPAGFFSKLENDDYYVNIHTAANPNGEIRGQLNYQGPLNSGSVMNGDQENPAVNTMGSGVIVMHANTSLDTLSYAVLYKNLSDGATAAHIHNAQAGSNGPVVVPLTASALPGIYQGKVAINKNTATAFLRNDLYANIHTAINPGGEIRGQFITNLRNAYAFDLCGTQEVPSNNSNGYGVGLFTINQLNTESFYELALDGLSGEATAAHIHEGKAGSSGGVLFPLLAPKPYSSGFIPIGPNQIIPFLNEGAYFNVHTDMFPGGEIRGQISRSLGCSGITSVKGQGDTNVDVSPNPVRDYILVGIDSKKNVDGLLHVSNFDGKTILQRTIQLGNEVNEIKLEASGILPGIYFLEIHDIKTGKYLANKKFIKL